MIRTNNQTVTQSPILSDEQQLLKIGIDIDSLGLIPRQKRTYYLKIVQCLRRCENMDNQQFIDNYLESIRCLCENKDFLPIQKILNTAIPLNQKFPEIAVPFSEYLLIKGFNTKFVAICENILELFANENINLLEIEFLFVKAKSGTIDRVSSYQLFRELNGKIEPNSLLYLESLVCLAYAQFSIGNYKDSWANFEKNLKIIENYQPSDKNNKIYEIKADVFEGMAYLERISNHWQNALLLHNKSENLFKSTNLVYKLISPLLHKGVINRKIQNYNLALQSLQEAKEIAIKINDKMAIEWINHHTAYTFFKSGSI